MKKIILLFTLLTIVTACDPTRENFFAPNKRLFTYVIDGPDNYQQGYLDGCETGLSTGFANDYYKTFYRFRKDIDRIKAGDKVYLRAWSSAMIYCRHYATGTLKEAKMSQKLPSDGSEPFTLGEDSLLGNVFSLKNWGSVGLANW